MHTTVKTWQNVLRVIISSFLSLYLVFLVGLEPLNALSDGQELVLESWNIVNEAYFEPDKFDEIQWKKLRQQAIQKTILSSEDAYDAIEGMLLPLADPYTKLLKPDAYQAMKASNLGSEINGVGLQLGARKEDGEIVVISCINGSPAEDANISSGSVLIRVNGDSPKKIGLEATASMLRGENGSKVIIEIQAPGETTTEEVALERRSVDLRPVRTKRIRTDNHTLGYLRITQFSEVVPRQVEEALEELSEKEVEGIILDLRNNSGGLVSSGLAVANAFLSESPIVETKNREGITDPIPSNKETFFDGPLVTLVNKGTASASEILAGALQDNGRSQLLGDRTFGKGLIQTLTNLSDGSGLSVTVASYLTPSGRNIQNTGLEPDRYLDLPEPEIPGDNEDRWLQDSELFMEAILDLQNKELSSIHVSEEAQVEQQNPINEPIIKTKDD